MENSTTPSCLSADETGQVSWYRRFWLFWIAATAWRLCYLVISPLELAMDEAYYWDWGRLPDWGYYSKPPLIAWINTASTALFGATEFGVRLPSVLMGAAGLVVLFYLARRLFDDRTACWAAILTTLSPGSCLLNFIMTIDAPLMFSWLLALYSFWRAVEYRGLSSKGWWLILSLAIGMGVLSKQMMLIFPLLMLLFLGFSKKDRCLLRTPWPWVATAAGMMFLLPPLLWNAHNNWITFQHSAHHFEANSSFWRFLQTVPDFFFGQLLIVSPLTAVAFLFAAVVVLRKRTFLHDRRVLLLMLFSFFPLLLFFLESFRQRINGNWPAVFYPPAIILGAAWLTGLLPTGRSLIEKTWRTRLRVWAPVTGAALVILTYALTFILANGGSIAGQKNPLDALTGWKQVAEKADALRQRQPRPDRVFFVVDRRETAAELSFYLPDQPRIFVWNPRPELIISQYDLWPGPENLQGWDAIIIFKYPLPITGALTASFKNIKTGEPLIVPLSENSDRQFKVFLGTHLLSWP